MYDASQTESILEFFGELGKVDLRRWCLGKNMLSNQEAEYAHFCCFVCYSIFFTKKIFYLHGILIDFINETFFQKKKELMYLFAEFYGTLVNSVEVSIVNNNMYADT